MITSKVTKKAQTTIPKVVRDKLDIHPLDTILYEIKGDHVVLRKLRPIDTEYLQSLESTLSEWKDDTDYDDLL
jgi:AbrB family looped-hinge helix DNA binding protein